MRVLFAGASGFLGTALTRQLEAGGAEIRRLVRRGPAGPGEWQWDPSAGTLPAEALGGVDVVVNLAGAPIAHWPWTADYRRTLLDSRVETTRTIVRALGEVGTTPALVNASAVGRYGKDRGDEPLTEESARGAGFLADVVDAWEAEARAAEELGCRVVRLRTAVVLDARGGALHAMRLPFQLGLGGRFGDGSQWFSTISLRDYCAAVARLVGDDTLSGAFNLTGPEPATNADLTRLLGQILHRPTLLRVPAFALKAVLGDLSGELLGSLRVVPERLLDAGFTFTHPTLEGQLRAALS